MSNKIPYLVYMNLLLQLAGNFKSRLMQSRVIIDDTSVFVDARGYECDMRGLGLRLRCRDFVPIQPTHKFNRDGLTIDLIMQRKGHLAFVHFMIHNRIGQA